MEAEADSHILGSPSGLTAKKHALNEEQNRITPKRTKWETIQLSIRKCREKILNVMIKKRERDIFMRGFLETGFD